MKAKDWSAGRDSPSRAISVFYSRAVRTLLE
jgi:hypothetical protein